MDEIKHLIFNRKKRPSTGQYKHIPSDEVDERDDLDEELSFEKDLDQTPFKKELIACTLGSGSIESLLNMWEKKYEDPSVTKEEEDPVKENKSDESSKALALETIAENEKDLLSDPSYERWGEASHVVMMSFANLLYYHKSQKTKDDSDRIEAALSVLKTGRALKETFKDMKSLSHLIPAINSGINESMGVLGSLYEKKQITKGEKKLKDLEEKLIGLNRLAHKYPKIATEDHWLTLVVEALEDHIQNEKTQIKKNYRYYTLSTLSLMRTSVSLTVATTSSIGATLITMGVISPILSISVMSSFMASDIHKRPKHYREKLKRTYYKKRQKQLIKTTEKALHKLEYLEFSRHMPPGEKKISLIAHRLKQKRQGYRDLPSSSEDVQIIEQEKIFKLHSILNNLEQIEREIKKDLWEKEEETHRRRSSSSFEKYLQQKEKLVSDLQNFLWEKEKIDDHQVEEQKFMSDLFSLYNIEPSTTEEAIEKLLG